MKRRGRHMSKMSVAPYKLSLYSGVIRTADNAHIPEDEANSDWIEYQEWLAKGNTPWPAETPEETADRNLRKEIGVLRRKLRKSHVFQYRLIMEMFRLLKLGTNITNSDVRPELLAKLQELKQLSDRLRDIDE
jgi:hypothetical protein